MSMLSSTGATIIAVMVILAIHTMRKRGLTLAEAVKQGKYQVTRRGPPPPPKGSSRDKSAYNLDYGSTNSKFIATPEPAMARSGSVSSQRPLMAPQRQLRYVFSSPPFNGSWSILLALHRFNVISQSWIYIRLVDPCHCK